MIIWGTLLASIAVPGRVPWLIVSLPLPVRVAGLAIGLLGPPLLLWVMRSIGTNVSESSATRAGARLVTRGPYRFVRHPLYTVGTMMFFGLALAVQSAGLLVIVGLIGLWLPGRARHEERHLLASYGDAYRDYMRVTGRFLPRPR